VGGKTIEQWIKEVNHKDASRRSQAIHMILYFGPEKAYEAVPVMLAELKKHTPEYPLDASVRHNLVLSLGMIIGGSKDPDTKYINEASTYFRRLLKDNQVMVRYRAAQALGLLGMLERSGPSVKASALELVPLIKDTATWEIRQAACISLGQIAGDSENGPNPAIIKALYMAANHDSAQQVRLAAVQSLAFLGAPADKVMKAELLKYLDIIAAKDHEPMVQIWANMAVMSIAHTITEERMSAILQIASKSERSDCKIQACQSIGTVAAQPTTTVATKAKAMAPAIVNMLADRDPGVVFAAMWALIQMESQTAIPVLEKMTTDPNLPDPMKKAAKEAIEQLQKKKDGKDKK
jgi:HEAT repeat protein